MVLLQRPEVMARTEDRYRFFLVDEFQDTNGVQRDLLERLALPAGGAAANLFIVGDRKQSIYGFRGADVDVFREMTSILVAAGGEDEAAALELSQSAAVDRFLQLSLREVVSIARRHAAELSKYLDELGYVKHEDSEPKRELRDEGPLVELMVTTKVPLEEDPKAEQDPRVLDAKQIARRITGLMNDIAGVEYGDIALLFRAMTHVQIYESAFRQANIPYQTVLGRGFYEREEITDLIQLCVSSTTRLTNSRSRRCCVRRCAGFRTTPCWLCVARRCCGRDADPREDSRHAPLYTALHRQSDIEYITDEEHELLERACTTHRPSRRAPSSLFDSAICCDSRSMSLST